MTFTEAALEVLRTAGEPLHYKKITELAIERNLLSHVGKTPEVTMSSRLAMMVKKDRGQAPIIKVKPGVFAIRESALQGATLSPEALAAISEVEGIEEPKVAGSGEAASTLSADEGAVSVPPKAPSLPGSDVFPEEEGDDDPILAGLEQESDGGERSGRRRRRRRRRKGEKPEGTAEAAPRAESGGQRERFRDRPRQDRQDRQDRQERPERSERQDRGERFDRQSARSEERRGEERERNDGARAGQDESLDWNRQPADGDLLGKDLADAVAAVLARGDRAPHTFSRVAELLVRRGRLSGSPAALSPTIAAAVRADIARAELLRARPRFRLRGARLSLSDWHLPKGLQRAEQDMLSGAERYASELRRALIQKLSELPTAGFAELLATWLNAEGVTALRAVRRPGSSGSELHFAGTRKTGSEEVRLAIVVQRGSRDIDREAIIDVRGALHHYGQAQVAWVVTLGRITSGAREEAAAQAAACALFDGQALAAAMERLGVAVRRNVIPHHEIDYDLLEALGDSPEQRERREREQERERREHNERTRATQQSRGRSGRGGNRSREERDVRDSDDEREDQGERSEARPVKLRDADWDDESLPHSAPEGHDGHEGPEGRDGHQGDEDHEGDEVHEGHEGHEGEGDDSSERDESLAPRGYTLRDTADDRRDEGEALRLRDELDSDADESVDDEDFSTSEEHDDEYAASDDADADDDDSGTEDDDLDADAESDDAETDEDYRAGIDEDIDTEDSEDSDDDASSDDAESDDSDSDETTDEAQPTESTGRARRRS